MKPDDLRGEDAEAVAAAARAATERERYRAGCYLGNLRKQGETWHVWRPDCTYVAEAATEEDAIKFADELNRARQRKEPA